MPNVRRSTGKTTLCIDICLSEYLGRLGPADSKELIEALGSPIGLLWETDAITYVLQQTGGHPALLRSMGSTVHALTTPRTEPVAIPERAQLPQLNISLRQTRQSWRM